MRVREEAQKLPIPNLNMQAVMQGSQEPGEPGKSGNFCFVGDLATPSLFLLLLCLYICHVVSLLHRKLLGIM